MAKISKSARTASFGVRNSNKAQGSRAKPTDGSDSQAAAPVAEPKAPSKQLQLAALVVRDEGATLDQMTTAMGWLPHTTRAALTGLKKKGYVIGSDKVNGVRTYRAVAPE